MCRINTERGIKENVIIALVERVKINATITSTVTIISYAAAYSKSN